MRRKRLLTTLSLLAATLAGCKKSLPIEHLTYQQRTVWEMISSQRYRDDLFFDANGLRRDFPFVSEREVRAIVNEVVDEQNRDFWRGVGLSGK